MSSLYKYPNGVYYLSFYDASRTPPRKTVSTRLRSKRDAERLQSRLDVGVALGDYDPFTTSPAEFLRPATSRDTGPDLSRFGDASEAFLASRSNLRPTTRERYRSIVGRLAAHVGRDASTAAVATSDVQAFIDSTPTKPVTAHNYRRAISTLFRWLEAEGVRSGDPTRGVRLPRVPEKYPRYLSRDDVEAICGSIVGAQAQQHVEEGTGLWLLPVVRANVYLGLRASEVVHLRWDDVDLERGTLTVRQIGEFSTKAGRDRTLPLAAPVAEVLGGIERRSELVFPSHTGRRLGRHYLSRAFKRHVRAAGLPEYVNFHTTRHTAASWLAEGGASVEAIRLYMGHSSVTVTQRYMHLAPDAFAGQIDQAFNQ